SNDSLESPYCTAECEEAKRLQKQILPVIVRPDTDYPSDLDHIQMVQMSNGFTPDGMSHLHSAILYLTRHLSEVPFGPTHEARTAMPEPPSTESGAVNPTGVADDQNSVTGTPKTAHRALFGDLQPNIEQQKRATGQFSVVNLPVNDSTKETDPL